MANEDKPLDHAIILDTEEDVCTKMGVCCHDCGNELEITTVEERAEVAVILSVGVCENCKKIAYHAGFHSGSEGPPTRGF